MPPRSLQLIDSSERDLQNCCLKLPSRRAHAIASSCGWSRACRHVTATLIDAQSELL